jgi:hypothetical protein
MALRTLTADEMYQEIAKALAYTDTNGKDLEKLANEWIPFPVKYVGDSLFTIDD